MKDALIAWLLASDAIAEIVEARVFWRHATAEAAYPLIVCQRIGGRPDYTHSGANGWTQARVQVSCDALDDEADTLAEAVINRLNGYRGLWGDVRVTRCVLTSEADAIVPQSTGEGDPIVRIPLDFEIDYYGANPDHT